jgi:hypothetical protein
MNGDVFLVVISADYIANYKVLRESIRAYCPTQQIVVAMSASEQDVLELRDDGDLFQTVIDINKMKGMKRELFPESYSMGSYLAAVRYKLVNYLFETTAIEKICLIGADMRFYQPANLVFNQLPGDYSLAVTPHILSPIPDQDGKFPSMRMIQLTGHLNADFIIFKNNDLTRQFVNYIAEQLETKCVGQHRDGIFFDQTFLGLAYIFMPNQVYTISHPGINMAYYNLHERVLDNDLFINGITSLICFHFSGFDGTSLSRYMRRKEQLSPAIVRLALEYQDNLNKYVNLRTKLEEY